MKKLNNMTPEVVTVGENTPWVKGTLPPDSSPVLGYFPHLNQPYVVCMYVRSHPSYGKPYWCGASLPEYRELAAPSHWRDLFPPKD